MFFNMNRFFINLLSTFILNRDKRVAYKNRMKNKLIKKKIESARFGVSYSVFDGEELLEASLNCIRSEVDYINVVYQNISWYGIPARAALLDTLIRLKKDGMIDELIEFIPDLNAQPGKNEIDKRNIGLDHAKKRGCNYFMTMDCDEMYVTSQIKKAKLFILTKEITHSFCKEISYGFEPEHRIVDDSGLYVSFFSKINRKSKFIDTAFAPCVIDPTRKLNNPFMKIIRLSGMSYYVLPMVSMHHMSRVRIDLPLKLSKFSKTIDSNRTMELLDTLVNSINTSLIINVSDHFLVNESIKKYKAK